MGIISNLSEKFARVRVIPNDNRNSVTNEIVDNKDTAQNQIKNAIDAGKRVDLSELSSITSLKGTRDEKYTIYEEMVADGRIGSAIEMYANDTVQYDQNGEILTVEAVSEDKNSSDVVRYVEKLIEDLNIKPNLWSYAYCMWLYGDVYLETFMNTSNDGSRPTLLVEPIQHNVNVRAQKPIEGAQLERYVEKVPNPAEVWDLQYKGKTAGFIRSRTDRLNSSLVNNCYLWSGTSTNIDILEPTKYIHICLSPNINRFPETFSLTNEIEEDKIDNNTIDASKSENNGSSLSFQVRTGQSVLENVYNPYESLKLKEDSVLLERVTKSSITRIIQLELGQLPEAQKRIRLQELKNQIEQQLLMNKETGSLQSRAGAQPIENIIYTSTNNGKGAITATNIGGDVDIGDLKDIDKAEDKLYGSLMIPKALLGSDMEGSGLSNGGSLTEMNTTYARRIKRGQIALLSGLTTLVDIFAMAEGMGDAVIGNYRLRLTPIITVEDNRRDELMHTKIDNVSQIMGLFDGMDDKIDIDTKIDMLTSWLSSYLNQQDIVDIINKRIQDLEDNEDEEVVSEEIEEEGNEQDADKDFGSDIGPSNIDRLSIEDRPKPDIEPAPKETEAEKPNLETPESVDLTNIEGEDLV